MPIVGTSHEPIMIAARRARTMRLALIDDVLECIDIDDTPAPTHYEHASICYACIDAREAANS